jgi:hypothetical protein
LPDFIRESLAAVRLNDANGSFKPAVSPCVHKLLQHLQPSLDNGFELLKLPRTVCVVRKIMPKYLRGDIDLDKSRVIGLQVLVFATQRITTTTGLGIVKHQVQRRKILDQLVGLCKTLIRCNELSGIAIRQPAHGRQGRQPDD